MKKFIFVPVVKGFDLLEKAVKSIKTDLYDEYIIFNNSEQEIPEEVYSGTQFRVWTPERRMTFTETQNIMQDYAIENAFDFFSFMHNDGEVLDNTDIELVKYAESLDEKWSVIFTNYDVLCAFNTEAVKVVGKWGDDKWPPQQSGYLLDNDYYRRVRSYGYPIKELYNRPITYVPKELVGGVSHIGSNTIKDPYEHSVWVSQMKQVYNHYVKKWGGEPGQEKYEHAYNIDPNASKFPNWFSAVNGEKIFQDNLKHLQGVNNLNFLEIGSFTGDSAVWMLENILTSDSSKLTCIDTWAGSAEHEEEVKKQFNFGDIENEFDSRVAKYGDKVIKVKSYSQEWLMQNRNSTFDFIYIDGDHFAKSVILDSMLSWDLLKSGGIMAFDDYEWEHPAGKEYNPKIAIDAFLNILDNSLEVIYRGWQLWIRKK